MSIFNVCDVVLYNGGAYLRKGRNVARRAPLEASRDVASSISGVFNTKKALEV